MGHEAARQTKAITSAPRDRREHGGSRVGGEGPQAALLADAQSAADRSAVTQRLTLAQLRADARPRSSGVTQLKPPPPEEYPQYFNNALALLSNADPGIKAAGPRLLELFQANRFNAAIAAGNLIEAIRAAALELGAKLEPMLDGQKLTPMGRGSSHKIAFEIQGEAENCFVSIPIGERGALETELRLYGLLGSKGVRIPKITGGLREITFEGETRIGVVMEKLKGTEYKQTLTWFFVKKQIAKWDDGERREKMINMRRTMAEFVASGVFVTDLQVFILDPTGEMVVFDPSTAAITQKPPENAEIKDIIRNLDKAIG